MTIRLDASTYLRLRRLLAGSAVASLGITLAALSCKGRETTGPSEVESVTVSPASTVILQVNQSQQLSATALDVSGNALPGQTITWTSSNSAVATVSAAGLVTAVTQGTATVTASCAGRSGGATVIVQLPVATMTVAQSSATLSPGLTLQLTATPTDANGAALIGQVITWSSSDTTIAAVTSRGLVTAIAIGVATITATTGAISGSAVITVTGTRTPVASVTVLPDTVVLLEGPTGFGNPVAFRVTLTDSAGTTLSGIPTTWTSSDTSVAQVTQTGQATPNPSVAAPRIVTITVTSEGKTGTATLIVNPRALSVVVTPANGTVPAGQTLQLTATPEDANGDPEIGVELLWATPDTLFARISENGVVTGIAPGTATIYASDVFNRTGMATITVTSSLAAMVTPAASVRAQRLRGVDSRGAVRGQVRREERDH